MDMGLVGTWNGQAYRLCTGREQQSVITDGVAAGEYDLAGARLQANRLRPETEIDLVFRIVALPPQRDPALRRLAGKEVLGEIRPVGGRRLVVAEHDDAPGILLSPQHFRGGKARRTAADDDDLLGICFDSTLACCRFSTLALSNDEDMAVALFHPPARQQPNAGARRASPVLKLKQA